MSELRVNKTIEAYESTLGYTDEQYAAILAEIDQYASEGNKLWILSGNEAFNMNAYKRRLVLEGYNVNYLQETGQHIVYWQNLGPTDVKNFQEDYLGQLSSY